MAYPDIYDVEYSYTGFQLSQGNNDFPGTQLDADLAGLSDSIANIAEFIKSVMRSDGALNNGIVTYDSLSATLQTAGLAPADPWESEKVYGAGASVIHDGKLYRALVNHISGDFAADLTAAKWKFILELPPGSYTIATQAEAEAGSATNVVMSPKATDQYVKAHIAPQEDAEDGTSATLLMSPKGVRQALEVYAPLQDPTLRLKGVGVVDLTQPPYNLNMGTPTVDQAAIINQAFADYEGAGATLVIPAFSGPNLAPAVGIASSINYTRGVTLRGGNGYGGNAQSDENYTGAVIKWIGGNNGKMVDWKGVNHSGFRGIKLDGNGRSGMIGLHLWSENAPPQSYNIAKHFVIKGCFKSIVLSDPSDVAYWPGGADPNNVGRAQNDSIYIEDFVIFGDGTDNSTGIHVNGTNTAQSSLICRGNIQSVDYGVRVIQNNGNLKLQQLNGGNASGSHKTFIRLEPTLAVMPLLEQCETEGNWNYSVHDSSYYFDDHGVSRYAPYTTTWLNNQFNGKVLIDGTSRIVSISNAGGSSIASGFEWVVGGNAIVWSIGDTQPLPGTDYISPWQTADNGEVFVIGERDGTSGVYAGQVAAGLLPSHLKFLRGAISSSTLDNSGDSSRFFMGNTGDRYVSQNSTTAWMTGVCLSIGGVPVGSPSVGDVVAMRDSTHGAIIFGGDMLSSVFRDGNDVKITGPGTGSFLYNGQTVGLSDGSPIGQTTAAPGKFTTLEATSQLLVPALGPGSAPSILNASSGIGMGLNSATGVNFFASGVDYANFGPSGFNTYRNGNPNVGVFGRTDNHGAGAAVVQLNLNGTDSGGTAAIYSQIESAAVTVTPGATDGRLRFKVAVAGTQTIIAEARTNGFNIATGSLQMAAGDVIDSNSIIKLRSYTVATVPSAATAGKMIYVSNESGGATPAFSDGTNWRRVADRAVVS